jgi:hypothetical protein
MKTVTVSPQSKSVQNLLKQAAQNGLILKSSEGKQFVLTPIDNWLGFDVGKSDDFAKEAEATLRNKKLMKHLAARRNGGKRIPLKEVKKQLGLR